MIFLSFFLGQIFYILMTALFGFCIPPIIPYFFSPSEL